LSPDAVICADIASVPVADGKDPGVTKVLLSREPGAPFPFSNGTFQLITSLQVLHHVRSAELRHTLCEFARILSPGGCVIMREHDAPDNLTKVRGSRESVFCPPWRSTEDLKISFSHVLFQMLCDVQHTLWETLYWQRPLATYLAHDDVTCFYRSKAEWHAAFESAGFEYLDNLTYPTDVTYPPTPYNYTGVYYAVYRVPAHAGAVGAGTNP
jgi:SAM-dependent methyltransferase